MDDAPSEWRVLTLTGHAADVPKLARTSGHVTFFPLAEGRNSLDWVLAGPIAANACA